jgi:hypothetical protein
MRVPKPLYESLPFLYGAGGACALAASYAIAAPGWSLLIAIAGVAGILAGLVVWLRRRDYRTMQERYRGDAP